MSTTESDGAPPAFRGFKDLSAIDPASVEAAIVVTNFRNAMKYEPACYALNALTERIIHGEAPLPQEIDDAKKALAEAGFRTSWEDRDFAPGVYGYPADDEEAAADLLAFAPRKQLSLSSPYGTEASDG